MAQSICCDTHLCKNSFDVESPKPIGYGIGKARSIVHQFGWRVINNKDICPKCIFLQFGKDSRALERCDLYIVEKEKEKSHGKLHGSV